MYSELFSIEPKCQITAFGIIESESCFRSSFDLKLGVALGSNYTSLWCRNEAYNCILPIDFFASDAFDDIELEFNSAEQLRSYLGQRLLFGLEFNA